MRNKLFKPIWGPELYCLFLGIKCPFVLECVIVSVRKCKKTDWMMSAQTRWLLAADIK